MKTDELKIVITGAGSGMGRHFATKLVEKGAKVAAWDLNENALKSLQSELESQKGQCHIDKVDVSKEEEVIVSMKRASQLFSGINGLINNAGITQDGLLIKKKDGHIKTQDCAAWQKVLDVNLTGPFLCSREFSRNYLELDQKSGVIINISSISAVGNIGQANYSAAKAGLIADTVVWAKELSRHGIRVGAIAPGFINTPILKNMRPEMLEKMIAPVPLKRLGEPGEIWQAIKFILECNYFTGRVIEVDGGLRL